MTFSLTQFPAVFTAKKTGQRTFAYDCEHWSRADKIKFLEEAASERRQKTRKRRAPQDRLRSLLGMTIKQRDSHGKIVQANIYTQKELAEILGVSTRTLRRFKNQKGYDLHSRTWARIKKSLVREETQARRYIERHLKVSSLRYLAWRIGIKVPPGVGSSGDIEDAQAGEARINESDEDEFIMAGPFSFDPRSLGKIAGEINYHEDAGRIVVSIFLIEKKGTP